MLLMIRIMKIREGELDRYVELYDSQLEPIMQRHGLRTFPRFVHRATNEFFWIRLFESEEDMHEKRRIYGGCAERSALGTLPESLVMQVEDYFLHLDGGIAHTEAMLAARVAAGGASPQS